MRMCKLCIVVLAFSVTSLSGVAYGISLTIYGSDAIYLAGRTDIAVPLPSDNTWDFLIRHVVDTPEEIEETHPPCIPVGGCSVVNIVSASGGINFFNGLGPPFYSPSGNGTSGSNLDALDGISGYIGPEGPLAGVFLDDSIPDGTAPATLDFTPGGLGTDFLTLSPELGQVFYIGDGLTDDLSETQSFIAPAGATRLCLGIPDGFGFDGHPGAYDDNDGSYEVELIVQSCETAYAYSEASSACFSELDVGLKNKNWGWTTYLEEPGTYVFDLYAGAAKCDIEKGTYVGEVEVDYSGGEVSVDITMESGCTLCDAHVYAGTFPVPLTTQEKPTVSPGQYYIEPDLDGGIYVIVHAVVCCSEE